MRNSGLLPVRREQEGNLSLWGSDSPLNPSAFFGTSPWQMMRRMQEDMDRVFSQYLQPVAYDIQRLQEIWSPSVDISQDDREWLVEADLPGVNKDDIHVQVERGQLLLRAELRQEQEAQPGKGAGGGDGQQAAAQRQYHRRERRYGYFERRLPLPENVDEERIHCEFKDGVLKIHLPKTEVKKPQARRIPIGGEATKPAAQLSGGTTALEHATSEKAAREPAMAGVKGGEKSTPRGKRSKAETSAG